MIPGFCASAGLSIFIVSPYKYLPISLLVDNKVSEGVPVDAHAIL